MGKIVFAEILDRRGHLRERVRIDSFPATVGRSYANAVIVDDPLVSAEHLRLSLDGEGGILVEDLNTVNGTRLSNSRERIERHTVAAGGEAVIRIGQTVLRFRGDDFAFKPAASSRSLFGPFGRIIENGAIAIGIFIAGFGAIVLAFAQEIEKKVIWSDLTSMSLVLLVVFAVWTGFWSFLSRLVVHSFRFMAHLAISGIASLLFLVVFTGIEYFEFMTAAPAATLFARFGGFVVIFSVLLYSHLSAMSDLARRKRMLSSALISTGILGIVLLIHFTKSNEFSNELRFSSVMKPVDPKWVRAVESNEFFEDLEKLKSKIDARARKDRKEESIHK
jgi:hypothetical protein